MDHDHRTHFRNQTGSFFTKLECQLACALVLYVRTRTHRRGGPIDHSQPPTLEMLNGIISDSRMRLWSSAQRSGVACNPMPPDAYLDAYCLVRNLRRSSYQEWYDEVWNDPHPRVWSERANNEFETWVLEDSTLVQRYVLPITRRPVNGVMAANTNQSTPQWYTGTVLVMGVHTNSETLCHWSACIYFSSLGESLKKYHVSYISLIANIEQTHNRQTSLNVHTKTAILCPSIISPLQTISNRMILIC